MPSLTEEDPEYAAVVVDYLARSGRRRIPWGAIVVAGHLTTTRSTREIHARQEVGETAIALLAALGVSEELVDRLANLPPGADLVAALEALRAA